MGELGGSSRNAGKKRVTASFRSGFRLFDAMPESSGGVSVFETWHVFPGFPAFDFTDCSDRTDSNDRVSPPEAVSRAVALANTRGGEIHVELAKSTFSESIQDLKYDGGRLFPDIGRPGSPDR